MLKIMIYILMYRREEADDLIAVFSSRKKAEMYRDKQFAFSPESYFVIDGELDPEPQ